MNLSNFILCPLRKTLIFQNEKDKHNTVAVYIFQHYGYTSAQLLLSNVLRIYIQDPKINTNKMEQFKNPNPHSKIRDE